MGKDISSLARTLRAKTGVCAQEARAIAGWWVGGDRVSWQPASVTHLVSAPTDYYPDGCDRYACVGPGGVHHFGTH